MDKRSPKCPTLSVSISPAGLMCWCRKPSRLASQAPVRRVCATPPSCVNFVDIYIRTGLYPAALPSGLGTEAAGIVEDVGPGVDHIKAGDRVAYAGGPWGRTARCA